MTFTIRPASMEDGMDILRWRNDPVSRQMSRDRDVIAESTHLKWFANALWRDDRKFFIGENDGQKVGMMRFDRVNETTWEVSHNMAPEARGKGLGQAMVKMVLDQFACPLIVAQIREDNPGCWHVYEKLGFSLVYNDGENRHYKFERP